MQPIPSGPIYSFTFAISSSTLITNLSIFLFHTSLLNILQHIEKFFRS